MRRNTDFTRLLLLIFWHYIFPAAIVLFSRLFFTGRARCTNKLNLATDDKQNITRSISHLATIDFLFQESYY